MKNYYGTFMQKQAFKRHYVQIIIVEPDIDAESLARQTMFDHFGDKFVTVYDEEKFAGQVERFGLQLLETIYVTTHGFHKTVSYHTGFNSGAMGIDSFDDLTKALLRLFDQAQVVPPVGLVFSNTEETEKMKTAIIEELKCRGAIVQAQGSRIFVNGIEFFTEAGGEV